MRRIAAETIGTFILVFGGCGSAVFTAAFPELGIGMLGVALAFGLTVIGCVYALGPISGAHLNPAVSFGLAISGRFAWRDLPGYVLAQLAGAVFASALLLMLLRGQPGGYDPHVAGFAANGFGAHSPGGYGLPAAFAAETTLTFIFLIVVLGATRNASPHAGIAIGLTLTLVHLIGIPISNVSVNPARSTGPALFVGGWAIAQLWLFWLAPLAGAAIAGLVARGLFSAPAPEPAPAE